MDKSEKSGLLPKERFYFFFNRQWVRELISEPPRAYATVLLIVISYSPRKATLDLITLKQSEEQKQFLGVQGHASREKFKK